MMKGIDAPHYDAQRTTWGPTSDIVNMFQDTLVALDWDGRTPIPYLAKSWTISEDGRTYTFKLRDDVSFCSGKKFTADDVVYSFKRLKDPAIKGPFAWRAGNIKELRAPDPYTVEYELEEPFSELLLQLTMFTNVIHNKESVEALGKDYGIKGADGTGPWCFDQLAAAHRDRAEAPRRLQMGPLDVQEQGAGEVRKARHQDRARGFQPRRGDDVRAVRHHPPVSGAVHHPGQGGADADRDAGQAEFPAALFRLQDHAADGGRRARARGHEHRHQPRRDRQGDPARQCRSGLHLRRSRRARLRSSDQGHRQGGSRARQEAARRSRLETRRRRHPREGRHEAGAAGLLHRQRQLGPRRRGHPGLPAQDRRRLAPATRGTRPSRR